jgi:hypothetical protein
MHKLMAIGLLFLSASTHAQDKKTMDSTDRVIIKTMINPAEQSAGADGPNWVAIEQQVKASYTEIQTDRAITKAKIYYYYGRDWAQFSTAIVHYTEAYEDKGGLPLLNKNANFILRRSQNPAEWKAALGWIRHALDLAPDNSTYKATESALQAKINGQQK